MKREDIYRKLHTPEDIAALLKLADFTPVYEEADRVRREVVGDVIHLRAIIEFSNVCRRQCRYCGLNRENHGLPRYRMSRREIVETASAAVKAGYRTIVLQSGEDAFYTAERLGEIIADVKALKVPFGKTHPDGHADSAVSGTAAPNVTAGVTVSGDAAGVTVSGDAFSPAVTVSCGERPLETYRYWRRQGADRYLLKHETADPSLYASLHPCGTLAERIDSLKMLQSLGYETGSGFMVGLPGQTLETLGQDLLLLKEIPCRMAGIGPFIANPKTPLAGAKNGDPELARRCVAIARLLLPEANLPLTTALSVLSEQELESDAAPQTVSLQMGSSLQQNSGSPENPFAFGANVIMKKVTPDNYKEAYEIYPAEFKPTNIEKDRRTLEEIIRHFDRIPQ